jgi:hypothetical protein
VLCVAAQAMHYGLIPASGHSHWLLLHLKFLKSFPDVISNQFDVLRTFIIQSVPFRSHDNLLNPCYQQAPSQEYMNMAATIFTTQQDSDTKLDTCNMPTPRLRLRRTFNCMVGMFSCYVATTQPCAINQHDKMG